MNTTAPFASLVPDGPLSYPLYYSQKSSLLPFVTDKTLSLFLPIICYWIFSGFYMLLDRSSHPWLEAHRIHESAESKKSRNLASPLAVARSVLIQQALQIVVTLIAVKDDDKPIWPEDHRVGMSWIAPYVAKTVLFVLGPSPGSRALAAYGKPMVYFTYWYGVPILQYSLGM